MATDELSMRVGQTMAGLLNATLVSRTCFPSCEVILTSLSAPAGKRVSSLFVHLMCVSVFIHGRLGRVELIVAVSAEQRLL